MNITGSADKHRRLVYMVAAVLAVCALSALGLSYKLFASGQGPTGFWYLDLETGKLFLADTKALPPITAPSGGAGVRAHIYGCDQGCGELDLEGKSLEDLAGLGLFISHLERISDEGLTLAKQARANATGKMSPDTAAYMATMEHHLVRIMNGQDTRWVKPTIETTRLITEMLQNHCGGSQAVACVPGRE